MSLRRCGNEGGLDRDSWVKCDQPNTLEKDSAVYPALGVLSQESLGKIELALMTYLELPAKP